MKQTEADTAEPGRSAPTSRRRRILTYTIAPIGVAAALFLRLALDPLLGDLQPLSLFFGAVALAVWVGGYRPAIVATVLGYLTADYFFTDPRGEIAISTPQQTISMLTYLLSSATVICFGEAMRRAVARERAYVTILETQRQQLQAMHQYKDRFIATLAHELRNPLSSAANALQLLRRLELPAPHARQACAILERQTELMMRLVNDLLDISRINTGKLTLDIREVDLVHALTRALEVAEPRIQSASHQVELDVPQHPIVLRADPERLVQLFSNLISNSARYTPNGGKINISAEVTNEHATVRVCDNGIGIAPGQLEAIFHAWERTDAASSHSNAGLGLGLALVREIVTLHHGRVEAKSEGIGKGSEFIVSLPLSRSS